MDLYKRTGTNPFSSCMPILLQSPFFFGLFRVLNNRQGIADGRHETIGPISRKLAGEAEQSTLFGAQLSDKFIGADNLTVQVVTVLLIVLMSVTTFTTQHQLMRKNMPASALDNPFAKQQKLLLYLMPIFFAISGVNFPIGVLLYWLTTNVWSMCQQFYVIRRMPAPGSAAEKAMQERHRRAGKEVKEFTVKGLDRSEPETEQQKQTGGQRQQPSRKKKKGKPAAPPAKAKPQPEHEPQTDN
jgi:YidC/Oxa1 family membrane protein insertase